MNLSTPVQPRIVRAFIGLTGFYVAIGLFVTYGLWQDAFVAPAGLGLLGLAPFVFALMVLAPFYIIVMLRYVRSPYATKGGKAVAVAVLLGTLVAMGVPYLAKHAW
jgi:hypothetical protein